MPAVQLDLATLSLAHGLSPYGPGQNPLRVCEHAPGILSRTALLIAFVNIISQFRSFHKKHVFSFRLHPLLKKAILLSVFQNRSIFMIFDTHAHYDDSAFDTDREELLSSLHEAGVGTVVNVGASLSGTRRTVELTEKYPFIYGAAGVHPDEVGELNENSFQWLKEQCLRERIVAVGEIGLDYYWDKENHALQKEWFVRQLRLAKELNMPVIIHSREAAADTMDILKKEYKPEIPVVIHCYSYSPEMAREYVKMGYYLGIGGVLTFKNAKKLKDVVSGTPLEKILLETDAPYLAPVPFRGKRNDSRKLTYVAEAISEIKGITPEAVIRITEENALRFYRIRQEESI